MYYWNKIECIDRQSLAKIQSQRLCDLVNRLYLNVPFYHDKFDELGINPNCINSIDQLKDLPFTNKEDIRNSYPYGMFAVDRSEIIRLHASSGTTGNPTVVGYTKNDIEIWSEVMARCLTMGGVTNHDIVQNTHGYNLFTGGFGVHYGAEKIGACVLPISTGNTERQLKMLIDLGCTTIVGTPTYVGHIANLIIKAGLQDKISLKHAICGGEPWPSGLREFIEDNLNITATNLYGLSEIIGPGVASECTCHCGCHVNEDHFIPEIIDSNTGEILKDGKIGELVLTPITKEGFPLLRYRTHDICSLTTEKCSCGRTFARISPILGRTDDMIIIRGVNIYPSEIENVIISVINYIPKYLIIVDTIADLDTLEVSIETELSDITELKNMRDKLHRKLKDRIGISVFVNLVPSGSIQDICEKSRKLIDKRHK